MERALTLRLAFLGFCLLLAVSQAGAQTLPTGTGVLAGTSTLKIKGCGSERTGKQASYTLAADGSWTGVSGGTTLTGAVSPGMNGRSWSISYEASRSLIEQRIEDLASILCGTDFELTSSQITTSLKLNKRLDRAKVKYRATFSGNVGGTPRSGTYKTAEVGAWTRASGAPPAPPPSPGY